MEFMTAAEIFKKLVDDGIYQQGHYMCHCLSMNIDKPIYDDSNKIIVAWKREPHPWMTQELIDIGIHAIVGFMLAFNKPEVVFECFDDEYSRDPENVWIDGQWVDGVVDTPPLINLLVSSVDGADWSSAHAGYYWRWLNDAQIKGSEYLVKIYSDWDNRFELLKEYHEDCKWNP